MVNKLVTLVFLATLVLVNVHGEDDLKELDDVEEEFTEQEIEEDEETSDLLRPKRLFGRRSSRGGFGRTRTGGIRTGGGFLGGSRFGKRKGTSTRLGGKRKGTSTRPGGKRKGTSTRLGKRKGTSTRLGRKFSGLRRPSGKGGSGVKTRLSRTGTGTGRSRVVRLSGPRKTGTGSSRRLFRKKGQGTGGTGTGGSTGTSKWDKIGTIVDIASLGTDIVSTTLDLLGSVQKKIVIQLGNAGGFDWEGYTPYLHEGSATKALPSVVETGDAVVFGGAKKSGVSLSGVSGAICYRIQNVKKSFCIMFKVPWSGNNYWNVKVYDGAKQANADIYNDLQNGAKEAGTAVSRKILAEGDEIVDDDGVNQNKPYKIYIKDSSMTRSEQASLTVYLGGELKQGATPKQEPQNVRSLELALRNPEGTGWQGGTIYMNEGASVDDLPSEVDTEDGTRLTIPQEASSPGTGISGVVCYHFEELPRSFCVMFKVPYNVGNKWNVKVFDGQKQASLQVYQDLQKGAMDAGNKVTRKDLIKGVVEGTDDDDNPLTIAYTVYMKDGSMTTTGTSVMDVTIGVE